MITDANTAGAAPRAREARQGPGGRAVLLVALAGIALFVGGMVAGGGFAVLYFKRSNLAESPSPGRIGDMLVASLNREFTLTPDEKTAIRSRVAEQTAAMEESSRAYGEGVRRNFAELCGGICTILGPERARRWKDVMREQFGENASVYIQMTECHTGSGGEVCPMPEAARTADPPRNAARHGFADGADR